MSNLNELCKRLALLRELREYHDKMSEILGSEIALIGTQVFNGCSDDSTAQIRIESSLFKDGQERIITPKLKYRPTVIQEPVFFDWLRTTNNAALIKANVHAKTLESFVTTAKKNATALPTEDVLKVFEVQTAEVRRAPKKA